MKLNNLTFSHFEQLHKNGYNLDIVFLLSLVEQGIDIQENCKDSPKLNALCQSIYRKGLVSSEGKLTLTGKEVINFANEHPNKEKPLRKKAVIKDDFELWWKAYPGTDQFTHKGTSFTGTRSLRVKKDDCKAKIQKILEEGEYTIHDLIAALEYEVLQKKENSIKTKSNKMTFMQNSLTYLNQRTFEPFIELIREGHKIEESPKVVGGTDI